MKKIVEIVCNIILVGTYVYLGLNETDPGPAFLWGFTCALWFAILIKNLADYFIKKAK